MPSGGRRPYRIPSDVPITGTRERGGRRRGRVERCPCVLRAEDVYGERLCERVAFGPGSRFRLSVTLYGAIWEFDAEVLPNAVWRRGRLFLLCPHCQRRATRLYVPIARLEPLCRRCWGLA